MKITTFLVLGAAIAILFIAYLLITPYWTDLGDQATPPKLSGKTLKTGEVTINAGDHSFKAYIVVPNNWNKKCVILVHGLGASKEKWIKQGVVDDLAKNGYCVLIFDLPLHGDRGKMSSMEQLPIVIKMGAEDVKAAAEYLINHGASDVYLISRSLGSIVSAVALGNGAKISKAVLLLASANLTYLYEHGSITSNPKARQEMSKWITNTTLLHEIDPLYKLPNYNGSVHFHCGMKDTTIPPYACQLAYLISTSAKERKIFWHNRGHSMPKSEYLNETLEFFSGGSTGSSTTSSPEEILNKLYSTAPKTKRTERGEPPIHVLFVLHIEPKLNKSKVMWLGSPDVQKEYNEVKQELIWLTYFCSKSGVKMTALFNGWYMQLVDRKHDTAHILKLLQDGHEIGTHAHNICYDSSSDTWYVCSNPDRWFADAKKCVDDVVLKLPGGNNRIMCAMFQRGQYSQECNLMTKYGYIIGLGNRPEIAIKSFGHIVWNPWRASCIDCPPGKEYLSLRENFSTPFVSIDHRAQIGSPKSHNVDSTVPTLKRQFIILFIEWKVRDAFDIENKTWCWGVVHHPNYGSTYNKAIEEFFTWLNDNFVNKETGKASVIAVYSTASEVAFEYYNWESTHPGSSSFDYDGVNYPYYCEFAKNLLLNANYTGEDEIDAIGKPFKVKAFIFKDKSGETIIVLWNRIDTLLVVNLTKYFSGKVMLYAPWGSYVIVDADNVPIKDVPLIVIKN